MSSESMEAARPGCTYCEGRLSDEDGATLPTCPECARVAALLDKAVATERLRWETAVGLCSFISTVQQEWIVRHAIRATP